MLELYFFENSICSERALLVLAEKNATDWTPHHIRLFNREQFNPEYMKLNPKAQVPTLVHNGQVIRESSIICNYLDDLYAEPALKPADPVAVAHMNEWIFEADAAGYEGVASLSFIIAFRPILMSMSEEELAAYWNGQTVLARTQRQRDCVENGYNSPYAARAIATWEEIFGRIESTLADGRPWLMGDQYTLAEVNLAPFIARLDALLLVDPWLQDRPHTRRWWDAVSTRKSYVESEVGPTGDERKAMLQEGTKLLPEFIEARNRYLEQYQ